MLCARPGGEVVAALGDRFEREVWAEAVDLRQVLAEQRKQRCALLPAISRKLPCSLD